VEELLDKGADANMQGEYSVSPAHCAANAGQLDCLKMLLELGAQINICDDENQTPLHYVAITFFTFFLLLGLTDTACACVRVVCHVQAAYWGQLSCVQLLLEKGAYADLTDKNGRMASDLTSSTEVPPDHLHTRNILLWSAS
jgi:ankyrin repeat protein